MTTPTKIRLVYSAAVTNTTSAELVAAMAAVPLYSSASQDNVLGRLMGLTFSLDTTVPSGGAVFRALELNMCPAAGAPNAPPFFPAQTPLAEAAVNVGIFSTSDEDSATGTGAQTVTINYTDSKGHTGTTTVTLLGRTPTLLHLDPATIDLLTVTDMFIASTGSSGNGVGHIALCAGAANPAFTPQNTPPAERQDKFQSELGPVIAYIPNSYYSVAPTLALQAEMLTNYFTQVLQLALATPVTALLPALIP